MTGVPRTPRILLVDDDDIDREMVRRALAKSGLAAELLEAPNGWAALDLWECGRFDCVLLDYRMQCMDGVELFRQLSQRTPDSPVAAIFLTGHGNETLALEVIGAGAFDYVAKSELTPSVLRRAVQYALARKQYLQQLNRLATLDTLTRLANRALFSTLVEQAIARAKRYGQHFAVFLLDLDNFKTVNDTLGHPSGDRVLIEAARRLKGLLRESDTVARLGGDEFALLAQLPDEGDSATALAERIIRELGRPYDLDGQLWFLSASIGISFCIRDGEELDTLLKNADLALYKAKTDCRGTYRFYTEDLNARAQKKRSLEVALRSAYRNEEFDLHYQPRLSPRTGQILGAEALMRWHHAEFGLVPPSEFIPLAESTRLILPIGRWVLHQACAACASWQRDSLSNLSVSVNFSPVQLQDEAIVETVREALAETRLDPACLEIEITESVAMDDKAAVVDVLGALAALGIVISIDDFGTGYSSLARLHDLPIQKLKIDRRFVRDLTAACPGAPIVEMVIALGKHLSLGIVAEGVESEGALTYLAHLGCDEAQGYYYSKPLPAYRFRDWCREWARKPLSAADIEPSSGINRESMHLELDKTAIIQGQVGRSTAMTAGADIPYRRLEN